MSINRLIILSALLFASFFAICSSLVMSNVIGSGFRHLELQKSEQIAKSVVEYLDQKLSQLSSKNNDWTIWNELYEYANGRAPNFPAENFTREAFEALQIQSLVLVNDQQKVLAAFYADPQRNDLTEVPELFPKLRSLVGAYSSNDLNMAKSGLFDVAGRPMLVVARSIMKSDLTGPAAGTLYFCVDFDATLIARMKQAIGIEIEISEGLASDTLIAENKNKLSATHHYFKPDHHTALLVTTEKNTSQMLLNLMPGRLKSESPSNEGSTTAVLRLLLEYPRDTMMLGTQVATIVNLMVLAISLIGWLLSYIALRLIVINRIKAIQKDIGSADITDEKLIQKLRQNYKDGSLNEIDKLVGAIVRMLDRTIAAEALRDNVRAELMHTAKLASLGEMAGGIAHEINNPLAVISGRSRQLRVLLENNTFTPDKASAIVSNIEKTTERIASIVASLRKHARSGEGDQFAEVEVASIIDGVLELCRDQIHDKSIAAIIEIDPPNAVLKCREVQIGQVLLNLIKNAIDAVEQLPAQDRWFNIQVSGADLSKPFRLSLTNGGKKISEDVYKRLFQPFFTTKPVGKGTGLGLSISAGILRQHGGQLTLDFDRSHTCFVLEIPSTLPNETPVVDVA